MNKPQFFKKRQADGSYKQAPLTTGFVLRRRERIQNEKSVFKPLSFAFLLRPFRAVFHMLQFVFSKPGFSHIKNNTLHLLSFMLLLFLYLVNSYVFIPLIKTRFVPRFWTNRLERGFAWLYIRATAVLDKPTHSISRLDLIGLSLRNMHAKKTRTIITVGGMAIGIGAIVFLVSIGYGLQNLVTSRVASLEEMRQADVYPQTGAAVKITDKTLADFKQITNVEMALPLIAVVGRVNYQNSVSDMAVFGVTADYLKESAIKPVEGKLFDDNALSLAVPKSEGEVAGAATSAGSGIIALGEVIGSADFSIAQGSWIRVRETPDTKAKIIGYTKRTEGIQQGEDVWGTTYADDPAGSAAKDEKGVSLGKWMSAPVLLWKQQTCEKDTGDCEDGSYMVLRDKDGKQAQSKGYFAEINIKVSGSRMTESKVLGVQAKSVLAASDSAALDFVEIASESAVIEEGKVKKISLGTGSKKQAIVNRAMLKVLGIAEKNAVGKTFDTSFVVVGDLLSSSNDRVESEPATYTIIGVTPDEKTPVFYVPFTDVRSLGIVNFSQVKVVTKDQTELSKVRKQIEAQGYVTRSVADTVSQINSLFATIRAVLALLGAVALAVAALGMFNTLTVSLLERTREVGLMKAMGMKSSEIKELFLTESMIMGLFGGLLGIVFGFLAGKLLGLILSVFAIIKGVGFVDISYLPLPFLILIIGLSLIVGIMTGFYPARRATKISALNALRYE